MQHWMPRRWPGFGDLESAKLDSRVCSLFFLWHVPWAIAKTVWEFRSGMVSVAWRAVPTNGNLIGSPLRISMMIHDVDSERLWCDYWLSLILDSIATFGDSTFGELGGENGKQWKSRLLGLSFQDSALLRLQSLTLGFRRFRASVLHFRSDSQISDPQVSNPQMSDNPLAITFKWLGQFVFFEFKNCTIKRWNILEFFLKSHLILFFLGSRGVRNKNMASLRDLGLVRYLLLQLVSFFGRQKGRRI